MSAEKPREIAIRTLRKALASDRFVEELLEEQLAGASLSPEDRRLAQELTYGITRWERTLDWLIARKTNGRTQTAQLMLLLRLGLYQLFWLSRVPDHAAVHETVELVKRLGLGPKAGFANAVLRGYVREKEETRRLLDQLRRDDLSLGYSHPEWLCSRWISRWGSERTAELLSWNNSPPPTFARVNALRTDPGRLLMRWREEEEVAYDFFSRDWTGENLVFILKSHPPLARLKSFQDGSFYVQDPSTLLAVSMLDPKPGDSILDLCAAPGGKTTYIAQLMENSGSIMAQDIHPQRLQLVRENCERLGVTSVTTARPAETLVPELSHPFDRILLDAPCSNTGVMRRRVGLRWRIRPEAIPPLVSEQVKLLGQAALQLKSEGVLVYSTCSLEPEENQEVVRRFLSEQTGFVLETERELQPFTDGVDGAYAARLRRAR